MMSERHCPARFERAICWEGHFSGSIMSCYSLNKMVEILHMLFSPVQVLRSSSIGLLHVSNVT